jgi:superfamily I DNA/RNA helicase
MPDLSALNPQQRQAVETLHGPVLILAGAGTGKTRVITFRIAHLIDRGVAPANVLGVTFTNKAAREMKERVAQLVPARTARRVPGSGFRVPSSNNPESGTRNSEPNSGPTISTFHSLCARILRQHIEVLGYKRNFVIYDESEQLGAIRKILSQISAKGEKTEPKAILSLLSRFKNAGPSSAGAFADPSVRAMAEHVRRRYESALRACNAIDFDDLLLLTQKLFEEHPEVLEACRRKYRYVMVDEYQDTNAAQFRLVHLLCQQHRNLCVVGDDDQSIYGWRGAEISNLLDLEKHFGDVKVIKLEQNYRSTNTILTAANALILHNARRRAKRLWSQKGDGEKIVLHEFDTDEEEARTLVEEIEFRRMARRVPWGDQAILFRTNQQSRPLEMALRQAGVRYHLIGGQSYFDRREVRDLLAYLKVFVNPHDDVSLLRIANVPARGLSDVTMERLLSASQERHCSVFAAMGGEDVLDAFPPRTRASIVAFVEFVERVRAQLQAEGPNTAVAATVRSQADLGSTGQPNTVGIQTEAASPRPHGRSYAESPLSPSEGERAGVRGPSSNAPRPNAATFSLQLWADRFLDEIGYFHELRRSEKDAETAESRIRNLKDLMADLDTQPALAPVERLQQFLEDLTLDAEREEEKESAGDAVTLITMHSCKGLEFPHVYVVGLEDGLLPHSRAKVEGTMDEERRLFYVAITRAMQTLSLSHCQGRKRYGQIVPCHPSPFLKELPPELVENAAERSKEPVSVSSGRNLFAAMRETLG